MTVVTPKFGMGASVRRVEDMVYGEDGRLLSASMDYAMPRAYSVPFFYFEIWNGLSTTSAFDIKRAGGAGTIGTTPATLNVVADAFNRAYGIKNIDMPTISSCIWGAIRDAGMQ